MLGVYIMSICDLWLNCLLAVFNYRIRIIFTNFSIVCQLANTDPAALVLNFRPWTAFCSHFPHILTNVGEIQYCNLNMNTFISCPFHFLTLLTPLLLFFFQTPEPDTLLSGNCHLSGLGFFIEMEYISIHCAPACLQDWFYNPELESARGVKTYGKCCI